MTVPFRLRHADRIVAAFLLAVVAALVVALFFVVRGHGLFKRRFEYRTIFTDGGGLKAESSVRIAGIEVGSVRRVTLTPDDRVEVIFDVFEEYADRLRQDPADGSCSPEKISMMDSEEKRKASEAAKKTCGSRVSASVPAGLGAFLPSSGLTIQVGNRENPLIEPGGFVPADEPEGLNEVLARLQKEGIVQSAKDIVAQIDELLRRINDDAGPIQRTLHHVEEVTGRAAAGRGLVGEITSDNSATQRKVNDALDKLDQSLVKLQKATDDIANVTGSVATRTDEIERFIESLDTFANDAKGAAKDLQTFSKDAKEIPPDVRNAVANLNRRIDDLGDIIKGLKKSFPFSLVVEEGSAGAKAPAKNAEKKE